MNLLPVCRMAVCLALLAGALFIPTANATVAVSPVEAHVVRETIVTEARRNGVVPPALALAVARVESNFRTDALSPAGARGVMQIMPATALGEFGVPAARLWDGETNIRLGIAFLERLYRQYGNDWQLALSHYNGGTLKRVGRKHVPHSYTAGYVADVHRWWRQYQHDTATTDLIRASGGSSIDPAISGEGSDGPTTGYKLVSDMLRPVRDDGRQQSRFADTDTDTDADRQACRACAGVQGNPVPIIGNGSVRFARSVRVGNSRFR